MSKDNKFDAGKAVLVYKGRKMTLLGVTENFEYVHNREVCPRCVHGFKLTEPCTKC